LPAFPDFKDIEITHKRAFDDWFSKYAPAISELTFTNLFVRRKSHPVRWCILNDALCIIRTHGKPKFYPPVGGHNLGDIFDKLTQFTDDSHMPFEMVRLPESILSPLAHRNFFIVEDRANFDYIYKASDLAELPGRKYAGKRNLINKCTRQYRVEYTPITRQIIDQCLALQQNWCNMRRCDIHPPLAAEFEAIRNTLSIYADLDLIGGAVRIEGNVEAFALAQPLNPHTAVIHFEKANPAITGLYQLVNQLLVKQSLSRFRFINREQDLGGEGLRRAKLSYFPNTFIKKYTIRTRQ